MPFPLPMTWGPRNRRQRRSRSRSASRGGAMAGASRPRRPVLQPQAIKAPFKKPEGAAVPKGGPLLPQGLPQVPGSPAPAASSGQPSGVRGTVDANTLFTQRSYDNPQTKGYETDVGQGPAVDIRPPTWGSPTELSSGTTGKAKNA